MSECALCLSSNVCVYIDSRIRVGRVVHRQVRQSRLAASDILACSCATHARVAHACLQRATGSEQALLSREIAHLASSHPAEHLQMLQHFAALLMARGGGPPCAGTPAAGCATAGAAFKVIAVSSVPYSKAHEGLCNIKQIGPAANLLSGGVALIALLVGMCWCAFCLR